MPVRFEISSLTHLYDDFFMDSFEWRMNPRFLAESTVPGQNQTHSPATNFDDHMTQL